MRRRKTHIIGTYFLMCEDSKGDRGVALTYEKRWCGYKAWTHFKTQLKHTVKRECILKKFNMLNCCV